MKGTWILHTHKNVKCRLRYDKINCLYFEVSVHHSFAHDMYNHVFSPTHSSVGYFHGWSRGWFVILSSDHGHSTWNVPSETQIAQSAVFSVELMTIWLTNLQSYYSKKKKRLGRIMHELRYLCMVTTFLNVFLPCSMQFRCRDVTLWSWILNA